MRRLVPTLDFVLLLCCLAALTPGVSPCLAQSGTTLYVRPSSSRVLFPSEVYVEMVLANVSDLVAFDISLGYSSAVLEVLQVSVAPPFDTISSIVEGDGYMTVASTLLGPPYVSGSRVLFSILFHTVSKGTSPLHFIYSDLAQGGGGAIAHTTIDGTVQAYSEILVPDNFPTIQEAINGALDGDVVFVRNGLYYENLVVNRSISLVGEDRATTVIDGMERNQSVVEVTSDNVAISGFTVQNSSRAPGTSFAGIKVLGNMCDITSNDARINKFGIFVFSQGSRITNNLVTDNGHGIALYQSSETSIEENNASLNTIGISLGYSFNNTIAHNSAVNSSAGGHGICLASNSNDNKVEENLLMNNYHGMWLSNSHHNLIVENTIAKNELLGIELANSSDNIFYHNNFINNTEHVVVFASNSTWDNGYPIGGNYWSGTNYTDLYSGEFQNETGSDGIADEPYFIDEHYQDNYPLMNPFWHFADFNHDLKVDIYDIVIICGAYGSTPLDSHWNPICDIEEPYEIIDIYDVVLECGYYGRCA